MNKLILLIILIFLIGCNRESTNKKISVTPTIFDEQNYRFINESVPWNGKRIFFIHGSINSNHLIQFINDSNYFNLIKDLTNEGYEIITFDRPAMVDTMFIDNGLTYRKAFDDKLNQVFNWIESISGPAIETYILGVSLGGAHAVIAMTDFPKRFNKYVLISPCIDIKWLIDFRYSNLASFDYFSPISSIDSIKNIKGLIIYGNNDERVNDTITDSFVNSLKELEAPIDVFVVDGATHDLIPDINLIKNWIIQ